MSTGYFFRSAADGARRAIAICTSDRLDPVMVRSAIVASTRIGAPTRSETVRVTRSVTSPLLNAPSATHATTQWHNGAAIAAMRFTAQIII